MVVPISLSAAALLWPIHAAQAVNRSP